MIVIKEFRQPFCNFFLSLPRVLFALKTSRGNIGVPVKDRIPWENTVLRAVKWLNKTCLDY
jgi:hypothetical protein